MPRTREKAGRVTQIVLDAAERRTLEKAAGLYRFCERNSDGDSQIKLLANALLSAQHTLTKAIDTVGQNPPLVVTAETAENKTEADPLATNPGSAPPQPEPDKPASEQQTDKPPQDPPADGRRKSRLASIVGAMFALLVGGLLAAPAFSQQGQRGPHSPPDFSLPINSGAPSQDYAHGSQYGSNRPMLIGLPPNSSGAARCSMSRADYVRERYNVRAMYRANQPASSRYSISGYTVLAREQAPELLSLAPGPDGVLVLPWPRALQQIAFDNFRANIEQAVQYRDYETLREQCELCEQRLKEHIGLLDLTSYCAAKNFLQSLKRMVA